MKKKIIELHSLFSLFFFDDFSSCVAPSASSQTLFFFFQNIFSNTQAEFRTRSPYFLYNICGVGSVHETSVLWEVRSTVHRLLYFMFCCLIINSLCPTESLQQSIFFSFYIWSFTFSAKSANSRSFKIKKSKNIQVSTTLQCLRSQTLSFFANQFPFGIL